MVRGLLHPELFIERYGRTVLDIGLHKYDIGIPSGGFRSQCLDRRCRDTVTPISLIDGEIVDIDLASVLFELIQLVRGQTAYDKFADGRSDGDEVRLLKEASPDYASSVENLRRL
jgi:hypothetical protein